MNRIILAALLTIGVALSAQAQTYQDSGGTVVPGVVPIQPGVGPLFTSANPGKISGSFSASLSGFQPTPSYASLSVGASSSRVALPSGTVVVVYNTGANAAYVTVGGASVTATTSDDFVPAGGWMAFAVGSSAYLAGIETAGATTLNLSGGSGLPTGACCAASGGGNGSNASVGSIGSAAPASATLGGMSVGGTMTAMPGTSSGLKVDGSAVTQPVSAASLPLPTGAATAANQPTSAAQASTTSGQTGALAMGATAGSPPSETSGQTNALSLTTAGALRVDGSAVTQPVSGNVTANAGSGSFTVAQSSASSLNASVVGLGSAGSPSGGVLSIQGVSGGQPVPISGTVSASIGAFAPTPAYASPLAVSTTSSRVAAPTGTSIVVYNVGSNAAYVTVGGSSVTATTSNDAIQPGGSAEYTLGSNTYVAAITASGSTTLNISGGAGIAAISGSGSSGASSFNSSVSATGSAVPASATYLGAYVSGNLTGLVATANGLKVDGSAVTQPVSGTFWQTTQPVSAASLPLPSGAATAANQTTWQGATGSSVPANAAYIGANSGGNLTGLIQASASVAINISTATTTQLVALSSGKSIYVTEANVIAAGTGNITFEYGTGSNCGSGTTVLTGAYNLTAQNGLAAGGGLGPILVVPAGNALCALTSASVQMSGSVAYTQF